MGIDPDEAYALERIEKFYNSGNVELATIRSVIPIVNIDTDKIFGEAVNSAKKHIKKLKRRIKDA